MYRSIVTLVAALAFFGCDAITPFEPADPETTEGTLEPDPTKATITYQNRGDFEIVRIYAVECSNPDWGNGISVSIYAGETHDITVDEPGCYDLAAWWETLDGMRYTYNYDLNVEAGGSYTWATP